MSLGIHIERFTRASPRESLVVSMFRNVSLNISVFYIIKDLLRSPPPGMVVSMAKNFHEARFNRYLTNELARFVAGIHTCRREAFASLSKRGPLNPLRVALERVVLPDQSD